MSNSKNPGRPEELAGGSDNMASASILNFYTQVYNSRSSNRLNFDADRSNPFIPACTIGGNCPEEFIEERVTCDGKTIVRDTLRNRFSVESCDRRSVFYQDGQGTEATRSWIAADGRMIVRERMRAQIFLRGSHHDGSSRRGYDIDLETNSVSRESNGWKVTQHTTDVGGSNSANPAEGELHVNVSGDGNNRRTSLDFAASGMTFHASEQGIEITAEDGKYRFLLSEGVLYSLGPLPPGSIQQPTEAYIGADGIVYRLIQIPQRNVEALAATLGLNKDGGITIEGLTVSVDDSGNVLAKTESSLENGQLSISINSDGTQSVTSGDGYTSRIGPDGRVLVFDAEGNCEAYFDPFTGVIGNEHVQLSADFSCIDGVYVNLMGMVFEMVALHRFAQDKAQANAEAANALRQSDTDLSYVRGQVQKGTVGNHCFAALTGSINQLTAALGACLASGARENIAAIVASLGEVYTEQALAHFKYNSQLAGLRMGVTDSFALAKMQQYTGPTSDAPTVAHQFAPANVA